MFHKINSVYPSNGLKIVVQFVEGVTKVYDVSPILDEIEVFKQLNDITVFNKVHVGPGGYGVIWNDEVDLACDEIFDNGKVIKTPFDGLIAISEATKLLGLNESTLRKAIQYNKLVKGQDVTKYGNQWVVSLDALKREYGEPK